MVGLEKKLVESIEKYTKKCIGNYKPKKTGKKAIHDPIWGTQIFSPSEIALIDSPLIQKLRYIHQTSCAFYTFPSANHTRFEHSLGTTVVATEMVESLNMKWQNAFNKQEKQKIRLAAILHDCGHGFFSHISETKYEEDPEIIELKDTEFAGIEAHEILSYYIVRSGAFKDLFDEIKRIDKEYESEDGYGLLDGIDEASDIADLILGKGTNKKPYIGKVINGPFDADKIDYIFRDSYFTGLPLSIDIERLLYALTIGKVKNKITGKEENQIVIELSGINAIEQILFSKLQLYPCLYQHQKVRAADSMVDSFLNYMSDNLDDIRKFEKEGQFVLSLKTPADYLEYNDFDFLNNKLHKIDYLRNKVENFMGRCLPMRAIVISFKTVETPLELYNLFRKLHDEIKWLKEQKDIREEIYNLIDPSVKPKPYDIIVDIPIPPQLNEAELTYIKIAPEIPPEPASGLMPLAAGWLEAYRTNKWKGHVFCPDEPGLRKVVRDATKKVFKKKYGIEFNNLASILAKVEEN